MATIIGPSFSTELRQGGVLDFRFTWGPDGNIQYHPEVPAEERAKVEAVLAAHDGPLSEARHEALTTTDAEAGKRIAGMFRKEPDTFRLIYKQLNALARAVQIIDRKIEGTALPEEQRALEVLDGLYNRAQAIRDTEEQAKTALLVAKSVEEIEKIKPGWPAD